MNIEDLPPNSNRSRTVEEAPEPVKKKVVKKVVNGEVRKAKKSGIRRLAEALDLEDLASVKDYVLGDVVVPKAKELVKSVVDNGIDMLFYGRPERREQSATNAGRVSYQSYYKNPKPAPVVRSDDRRSNSYVFENITLASRADAEEVLDSMNEMLDLYDIVSVADLYDLVGIEGQHTDNNYGWTDLSRATVVRTSDGYLLKLPKPSPING